MGGKKGLRVKKEQHEIVWDEGQTETLQSLNQSDLFPPEVWVLSSELNPSSWLNEKSHNIAITTSDLLPGKCAHIHKSILNLVQPMNKTVSHAKEEKNGWVRTKGKYDRAIRKLLLKWHLKWKNSAKSPLKRQQRPKLWGWGCPRCVCSLLKQLFLSD